MGSGRVEKMLFFLTAPSPLPLTRPISSSLQEFQHGAFAIKTVRARPMKTPALQATVFTVGRGTQRLFSLKYLIGEADVA